MAIAIKKSQGRHPSAFYLIFFGSSASRSPDNGQNHDD
ncbi:hypothetical protein CHCC20441_3025 [Bacillus licheniformis]|uniref:Uncharacterized protein n=1 Tax=Bacillus licheniformis TaxID=1402 RepID=A0A8B5YE81_BACLI|nr:hypothetical protein B4092_1242 [Bacillus licheniformis]KYC85212.1 hypothetical protein B4091_1273 [Bacillus licheniformis]KYC93704.1 hypothetical protein B4164_1004 [Bacillus licheniformis]TWJ35925.1 hypothetical protein CHCC5026_3132 [Bacillus licheniformis]TWJ47490.1 hypothetical protein CHCC5024_0698 [Bacillus licheniformis]